MVKIGDTIEIIDMKGEPEYSGRTGVVERIDAIGQLHGTWGGLAVTEGDIVIVRKKAGKKFFVEENTCPLCSSHNVEYGGSEINDNVVTYSCECKKCNAIWNEDYTLHFCGISQIYDKENNKLGNSIDLEGDEECPID